MGLCITVLALAEAKLHPMIALLQSLICHTWFACWSYKSQRFTQPSADQGEAEDSTKQLHLQTESPVLHEQQQQPHGWQPVPICQPVQAGMAVPQHALSTRLHQDTSELLTQKQDSEQEAAAHLSQQHPSQQAFSPKHQGKISPASATLQCNVQTQRLLSLPAEQGDTSIPRCSSSATCVEAQVTHLKLGLCALVLAALPCVAWLKQPWAMRQWACWQDALPTAIVAVHASILCLLVSASCPIWSLYHPCYVRACL